MAKPSAVNYYGIYGWLLITALGYFSTIWDYYCFPYLAENLTLLQKHGFHEPFVWSIMLLNLVLTNALVSFIYHTCEVKTVQWYVPIQIVLNMILTEVFFTLAHMNLHYTLTGAKIHLMYHCCKQASWSTNLIFHHVDMAEKVFHCWKARVSKIIIVTCIFDEANSRS